MKRLIVRVILGVSLLLPAFCAHAAVCGGYQANSPDVSECLGQELRDSDAKINASYQELMKRLDDAGKAKLRKEQRTWIKERDIVCHLDTKESDREKWYRAVLADYGTTVCVTRYTRGRTAELVYMLAQITPVLQTQPTPAAGPVQPAVSHDLSDYQMFSAARAEHGRWYLEVTIDIGKIAGFSPTAVMVGCWDQTPGGHSYGNLIQARASDTSGPILRKGFALDLEDGKFYSRTDGNWQGGAPGTSGGYDGLRLGRFYRCGVDSTTMVAPLVRNGYLDINFGEKPFFYQMPEGYRPLSEVRE